MLAGLSIGKLVFFGKQAQTKKRGRSAYLQEANKSALHPMCFDAGNMCLPPSMSIVMYSSRLVPLAVLNSFQKYAELVTTCVHHDLVCKGDLIREL